MIGEVNWSNYLKALGQCGGCPTTISSVKNNKKKKKKLKKKRKKVRRKRIREKRKAVKQMIKKRVKVKADDEKIVDYYYRYEFCQIIR